MSIPTTDNAFLDELELTVRAELVQAETSPPEEAACVPIDQWLTDPVDDQRYEIGLRTLFGAVEALEDRVRAGLPDYGHVLACRRGDPGAAG